MPIRTGAFNDKVVLPPESAALELVAREAGVGAGTLQRWREAESSATLDTKPVLHGANG